MFTKSKTQLENLRSKLKRGLKAPESGMILVAVLSLIVLCNPFSGEILASAPVLLFLAAFALFMVPGLVLSLTLPGAELAGIARMPVAFAVSAGIFGFAALPMLLLHRTITLYLVICGIILALSLGLAFARVGWKRVSEESPERTAVDLSTKLLWAPFLLFTGMLAWISASYVPKPAEDAWIYLSSVRDLLVSRGLGTGSASSRLAVDGWLPEQSMLSLVSGLDPVTLVLQYLAPTLAVIALLALYALAHTLLKNKKAALVISSLSALFFLIGLGSSSFNSVLAPATEFIDHITEDKYVARYVFVPVALSIAILFVRSRSWRNLGLFFFVCLGVAVVHPLGLFL